MKEETKSLIIKVARLYSDIDKWFAVEKGERRGWIFKYYLILYNPKQNRAVHYKACYDEYVLIELGSATSLDADD